MIAFPRSALRIQIRASFDAVVVREPLGPRSDDPARLSARLPPRDAAGYVPAIGSCRRSERGTALGPARNKSPPLVERAGGRGGESLDDEGGSPGRLGPPWGGPRRPG